MDPDLPLQKAISTTLQSEAVKKHQSVVRGDSQTNVDAIRAKQHYVGCKPQLKKGQLKVPNPPTRAEIPQKTCTQCGRAPLHSRDCYLAHNAKRRGTFSSSAEQRVSTWCWLIRMMKFTLQQSIKSLWVVTLGVNSSPVKFKIDIRCQHLTRNHLQGGMRCHLATDLQIIDRP